MQTYKSSVPCIIGTNYYTLKFMIKTKSALLMIDLCSSDSKQKGSLVISVRLAFKFHYFTTDSLSFKLCLFLDFNKSFKNDGGPMGGLP